MDVPLAAFHVEHIMPRVHGGGDDSSNLALACDRCNLHKGTNLTGIDPESGAVALLYNPRTQAWREHFHLQGATIIGLTPTGRATVRTLNMNAPRRVQLRAQLAAIGDLQ